MQNRRKLSLANRHPTPPGATQSGRNARVGGQSTGVRPLLQGHQAMQMGQGLRAAKQPNRTIGRGLRRTVLLVLAPNGSQPLLGHQVIDHHP